MPLTPGTRLGPYEVQGLLGAGGMGEVYRATDTNLKRPVAVKVLPEAVASDAERLARFRREAEVLASLNHPNIAHVYGLEQANGTTALIMELVEGETLAERLSTVGSGRSAPGSGSSKGAGLPSVRSGSGAQGTGLPLDEVLALAKQIVDALEAAHERGIVHRDLKPANIKVRPDGTVKVLDFGLARMIEPGSGTRDPGGLSQSPTITTPAMMTGAGLILGTAAYMSPEQARGKPVDRRADIWAFGCVLYEMLTGRRAFDPSALREPQGRPEGRVTAGSGSSRAESRDGGAEVADVIVAVLSREPDWDALPAPTPLPMRRLLRRCLTKDVRRRLADIADARFDLEEATEGQEILPATSARPSRSRVRIAAVLAGLAVGVLAGALAWTARSNPPAEIRFELTTPPTADPLSLAISPDGQQVVFVAIAGGVSQLWLRSLDSASARPLARTEGASYPFWSPDGRAVGFFTEDSLKTIEPASDAVQTLAPIGTGAQGGAWGPDGTIIYSPALTSTLMRVPAAGGMPAPATRLGEGEVSHRFPQFLPDGRHILYYTRGGDDVRGISVLNLDGGEPARVIGGDVSAPAFVASGHIFFVRQGDLFAQAFDASTRMPTGPIERLAERVEVDAGLRTALSVSRSGAVAYRPASAPRRSQFVWFARSGQELGRVGEPGRQHTSPSLSPDGRRIAMQQTYDGNVDIAVLDIERNSLDRITNSPTPDIYPEWSPDSRELVYAAFRDGGYDLYRKSPSEPGPGRPLLSAPLSEVPVDWSRDSRFILFRDQSPKGPRLSALPLAEKGQPSVVAENARLGQFSPDGRWVALESEDSGRWEVYVQPFPGPGERLKVSTSGGAQVRWRRDGRELYYIALDDRLMAVPVRPSADGRTVDIGAPTALFETNVNGAIQLNSAAVYVPSTDGQRFLMDAIVDEGDTSPIEMILNWRPRSAP